MAILALVAGVTATAPAAMAEGQNGGGGCYHNGVVSSCVQPAPVTLYPPSELGTVAGGGVHDVSVDVSRDQEGSE